MSDAGRVRRSTSTSQFGVGRRESHDASEFYARFPEPSVSQDEALVHPRDRRIAERFVRADARTMIRDQHLAPGSVALVVTSPPYFAGKAYEAEPQRDGSPETYGEYLTLLHEVFEECTRALEPGGRIAVNVANLGRRPYRSLSADVVRIFENLGLLLRGEVIWQKQDGSAGNCAWGSFMQPTNPALRDMTERVIIASKGRFDRARHPRLRERDGYPHRTTTTADLYMQSTLDLWNIPAENAQRIGHPAPFPVELPERLIHLYTWVDDLVLDPFMGAGSTLVAAERTQREYIGFDLDPDYVELARQRVETEKEQHAGRSIRIASVGPTEPRAEISLPEIEHDLDFQARATKEGKAASVLAERVLGLEDGGAGFTIARRKVRIPGAGAEFNLELTDQGGGAWFVDVSGAFLGNPRGGLRRTDTVWKSLGRANVFASRKGRSSTHRLLLLSSHLPQPGSEGDRAIRAVGPGVIFDVIAMLDEDGRSRLADYARGGYGAAEHVRPLPGYWTEAEAAELVEKAG